MSVVTEHTGHVVGGVEVAALTYGQYRGFLAGADNLPEDRLVVQSRVSMRQTKGNN